MDWEKVYDEEPHKLINNGDMAASIVSEPMNIERFDNVGMQVKWSGAPVGEFKIEASMDEVNFNDITPSVMNTTGSNPFLLNLIQCPYRHLIFKYNRTSGTGSLNVHVGAKSL